MCHIVSGQFTSALFWELDMLNRYYLQEESNRPKVQASTAEVSRVGAKQGKTALDFELGFCKQEWCLCLFTRGRWYLVTSGHWRFLLRVGDNSNINTGSPQKKTGVYHQNVLCLFESFYQWTLLDTILQWLLGNLSFYTFIVHCQRRKVKTMWSLKLHGFFGGPAMK